MDIPHYPGQAKDVALSRADIPKTVAPVSLDQLKLIPGKTYQALVTNRVETTDPATGQQALLTKTGQSSVPSDWILKLNGKPLLINTSAPLKTGQSLTIKLSPEQELLMQKTPAVSSTTAVAPAMVGTRLNNNAITTLLQAINQVMPRQVSLEQGFAELSNLVSRNNDDLVGRQVRTIMDVLVKNLPIADVLQTRTGDTSKQRSSTTASSATTSSPTENTIRSGADASSTTPDNAFRTTPTVSIGTLVFALKNSGLFFEQALSQKSLQLDRLASEVIRLQNTLKPQTPSPEQAVSLASGENKTARPPQISDLMIAERPQTEARPTKGSPVVTENSLRARLQSALNAPSLKEGFERLAIDQNKLRPNEMRGDANNQAIKSAAKPSASTTDQDLKGLLFKTAAALTALNHDDKSPNHSRPKTYVDALTQVALLKSPFNFPHLALDPNQSSIQKASSILADQELSTGQLLKLLAGMLNRIQFNQLNSLYQSHSNSSDTVAVQSWFFELPVVVPSQGINVFNLRIDREHEKNSGETPDSEKKQPVWKIALSFDLEALGSIYVQVNLLPPSISSTIWADQQKTLALINRETPYFRQRLTQIGLEVGEICCQKGQPKQNRAKLERSLVDIKA